MANKTIFPYGTGGSLPSGIGIINDLTTGGVDKALSAEQGKVIGNELYGDSVVRREVLDNSSLVQSQVNSYSTGAQGQLTRAYIGLSRDGAETFGASVSVHANSPIKYSICFMNTDAPGYPDNIYFADYETGYINQGSADQDDANDLDSVVQIAIIATYVDGGTGTPTAEEIIENADFEIYVGRVVQTGLIQQVEDVEQDVENLEQEVEEIKEGGDTNGRREYIRRTAALKKHFDERTNAAGVWNTDTADDCFCIAHGSDFHSDKTRYGRFRDIVDGVNLIDAAVVTGDYTDLGSTVEMAAMRAVTFERIQPKLVIGNHDRQGGLTIAQVVEGMGMTAAYYYVDYTTPKIRLIVLNEYDIASTTASVAQKDGHWSQTQIDWLLARLDEAITAGYSVMVAMHCVEMGSASIAMPTPNNKGFYQRNFQWKNNLSTAMPHYLIEDIIAAFRSGGTISGTYAHNDETASISLNHTFSSAGKFIAYMVGHAHIDMTGYSVQHPDQLYLVCPASCLIGGNNRFFGAEVSDLPRIVGTPSEDCFNVYGIDTINKIVRIARIGADMNDLTEKREVAYFDYEPK